MINVNLLNGVIRVHAGGMQIYVKDELQEAIVEQLVKLYPENGNGPIDYDKDSNWEEMGWECLTFMEEMNIEDFEKNIDKMKPLYIKDELVGYAIGEENQLAYQKMFNTFTLN